MEEPTTSVESQSSEKPDLDSLIAAAVKAQQEQEEAESQADEDRIRGEKATAVESFRASISPLLGDLTGFVSRWDGGEVGEFYRQSSCVIGDVTLVQHEAYADVVVIYRRDDGGKLSAFNTSDAPSLVRRAVLVAIHKARQPNPETEPLPPAAPKLNDGGQAFPVPDSGVSIEGMTLRDCFAAKAAGGMSDELIGCTIGARAEIATEIADHAYGLADAMIQRRGR